MSHPNGPARRPAVLLVESDRGDRELYSEWLEEDLEVLVCPGPSAPDYTCVGSRTGACPLGSRADIVLLETSLPGDVVGEGTSASDLVTLYTSLGKPVVGVAPLSREVPPPADWIPLPASGQELRSAVETRLRMTRRI